jgi:hypothetical protein
VLPNFLIIGAMKAGTSSLYQYVGGHPQVFMPEQKELQYFGRDDWEGRLAWYEAQFDGAGGAVAVGEASTNYSKYPSIPNAADQIATVVPKVKIVYVIRHPIDRAVSHYMHSVLRGREDRPIDVALTADPKYLDVSRYAMQIDRYLERFPRQQLLVIRSDDLRHRRRETVARVFAYLGVDPNVVPPTSQDEFYRTDERRERHPRLQRVRRAGWYRPALDAIPIGMRQAMWRRLEPLATWRVDRRRGEISPDLRGDLESRVRDDVARLRGYLGPDFDGWGIA